MPTRMSGDATVCAGTRSRTGYNCDVAANEKLAAYGRKRDFSRTPEPPPEPPPGPPSEAPEPVPARRARW